MPLDTTGYRSIPGSGFGAGVILSGRGFDGSGCDRERFRDIREGADSSRIGFGWEQVGEDGSDFEHACVHVYMYEQLSMSATHAILPHERAPVYTGYPPVNGFKYKNWNSETT